MERYLIRTITNINLLYYWLSVLDIFRFYKPTTNNNLYLQIYTPVNRNMSNIYYQCLILFKVILNSTIVQKYSQDKNATLRMDIYIKTLNLVKYIHKYTHYECYQLDVFNTRTKGIYVTIWRFVSVSILLILMSILSVAFFP